MSSERCAQQESTGISVLEGVVVAIQQGGPFERVGASVGMPVIALGLDQAIMDLVSLP